MSAECGVVCVAAKSRHTPWLSFATGNWWELVPGEDHDQGARAAAEAARSWAKRHRYAIEVRLPAPRLGDDKPWRIKLTKLPEGIRGT